MNNKSIVRREAHVLRPSLGGVGGGFLFLLMFFFSVSSQAQVYAQLKLWDSHLRYPKINEIEFQGADETLATYDAIYGHGAMWESEYVGFRIYMDHRQSIDLYGKKFAQMELDSTNFYSNAQWMERGYGEDILFAGQSVAAGSFRGYVDGKPTYVDVVSARGQRILNPGPDTVRIEVWDKDWQYQGRTLQMRQVYTMARGHRDVQIDIYLEGATDDMLFATGAQKLEMDNEGFCWSQQDNKSTSQQVNESISQQVNESTSQQVNESTSQQVNKPARALLACKARTSQQVGGLVGSWGRNVPDKAHPEFVEGVGIGVCVPQEYLTEVKEDDLNYLCIMHPVDGHIRYHLAVCADMQQTGEAFHDAKSWFSWLKAWSKSKKR